MKDIKIIVAAHKKYWMPEDSMYYPVHAGHTGKEDIGYTPDDTGDNISGKNPSFCELTGLYWAWKNLKCDYLGLVHYRRHFASPYRRGSKEGRVLTLTECDKLLDSSPVILPRKRNYFIETNYSQYVHAHHKIDLDETERIISEKYPGYIPSWKKVMKSTKGHRFNMFIMKRDLLDSYCSWLFDILFTLEKRLDISSYSNYDRRVFGFVSERLLDVWLDKNSIDYKEIPVIFMESENWIKKGLRFLLRKFKSCV